MKIVKKIIIGIALLLAIVVIAGFFYIRHIAQKGLSDYSENIKLAGIKDEVTVYRDSYAIPHIFAKNDEDLYRAVGYVMAQDRLWQMDLVRRATTGRLAEIFGEDLVETDLLMRSLRIPEKSRMVLDRTDESIIKAAEAFADGVNQYIETHKKRLPIEFSLLGYAPEKWIVEHSVNLIGYMAWDLALAWKSEVILHKIAQKLGTKSDKFKELIPDLAQQKTTVYPEFKLGASELDLRSSLLYSSQKLEELGLVIFSGSNNWAVSGAKSVTGKPLLANDMHLGLFTPGIWYQMHEVVEGKLNVTGVSVPGQPFVICGHNDRIAWGMTNVMVDDIDFYLEKINPANPNEYEFNGTWRAMEVRKEKIKIKGGKVIEKQIRFTHRGPIISDFKGVKNQALSMRWIGNEYSNEFRTVYLVDRAANWDEFKDAVRTFNAVSQNIVYADVDGNIGLYCSAGVPIRKGKGWATVPGETDEYEWKGLVPFEELPHSFNPSCGYVASANNKTANDDYPYYISSWFDLPYRIDRIREMLEEKEKLSVEDFCRMQADVKSKLVEKMRGDFIAEIKKMENLIPIEQQSIELLESWDGVLAKEDPAPCIFEKFYEVLVKNLAEDEMGEELYREYTENQILIDNFIENILRNKSSEWCDDIRTKDAKETFTDIVQKSFKETVNSLQEKLGNDPGQWEWGKLHTLILKHPMGTVKILDLAFNINRGPFPVGGSFHTVCPYTGSSAVGFESDFGASMRHVYSLASWDESKSVLPTGISGIPASKFYCDQTKLYLNNQYHSDYVSRDLIEKEARFKMAIVRK